MNTHHILDFSKPFKQCNAETNQQHSILGNPWLSVLTTIPSQSEGRTICRKKKDQPPCWNGFINLIYQNLNIPSINHVDHSHVHSSMKFLYSFYKTNTSI